MASAEAAGSFALVGLACCFLALNLVAWLSRRTQLERTQSQQRALMAEVASLKREAARLNTPSTYAKCAKLQRAAAAKEKELKSLLTPALEQQTWARHLPTLQVLIGAVAVVWWWRTPAAVLPRRWLWPFNPFMAMPHGKQFSELGWVAIGPFCYMCARAGKVAMQAVLPARHTTAGQAAQPAVAAVAAG